MRSLAFALLLSTISEPAWGKPCVAPTRSELAGVWVADAVAELYLLDLNEHGDGVLVTAFRDEPHQTYDVSVARLDSHRVEFRVRPIKSLSKTLYLRGTTCRGHLYLEVGSRAPKWKADLEFKLRDPLLERIRATSEAAENLKRGIKR